MQHKVRKRWRAYLRTCGWAAMAMGFSAPALAQPSLTESFYVTANTEDDTGEAQQALGRCSRSFADSLTQSGGYIERNSPEVMTTVSACVDQIADPSTQRACDLAAASASVDYIVVVDAISVSGGWLFEARAVSPAQNGTVWSADAVVDNQSDFVLAGRQGCRELGQNFLCTRNQTCVSSTATAEERSTLRLTGEFPTVATILVDGVEIGNTTQGEFALSPGTKRVEIRAPGFETIEQTVNLQAGQTFDLSNLELEPVPTTAQVTVNVAGAVILVNGVPAGVSVPGQPVTVNVPTGAAMVRVQADGYNTQDLTIAAAPGQSIPLSVDLTPGNAVEQAVVAPVQPAAVTASTMPVEADGITSGLVRQGELAAGDSTLNSGEYSDSWFYTAYAGETTLFTAQSNEFDTYLMVRGPNDFSLDNDDLDPAAGTDAGLNVEFPAAGEYRVIVTSYRPGETGRYTLVAGAGASGAVAPPPVARNQPPQPAPSRQGVVGTQFFTSGTAYGALEAGDVTLTSGEYNDTYTYTASGGELVSLRANSTRFDTYLMVRGPNEFTLDNDDLIPNADINAGVDFTIPTAGEYQFIVTSYQAGEVGGYELVADIRSAFVTPPPVVQTANQSIGLAPGMVPRSRSVNGRITGTVNIAELTSNQCHGYLQEGSAIDFSVASTMTVRAFAESATDTTMIILAQDDSGMWCDDDSLGNLNPALTVVLDPGLYSVVMGTYTQNATADFTVTLEAD